MVIGALLTFLCQPLRSNLTGSARAAWRISLSRQRRLVLVANVSSVFIAE